MNVETIQHPLAAGRPVREDEVWEFPEGLIGFPALKRFARVELDEAPPFQLLASLDEPAFALVIVSPWIQVPDYELVLADDALAPLGNPSVKDVEVAVSVVLPGPETPYSLNLRAPFLFSAGRRLGLQRASTDDRHSDRFRPEASGASSCSS
ncbi:MAG: flagellar assembly protein FliW [bacterium]